LIIEIFPFFGSFSEFLRTFLLSLGGCWVSLMMVNGVH